MPSRFDRLKGFKHILSGIIWSIIALYIVIAILIYIPSIQQFLGSRIASALSEKLKTKVEIGRVDIGLFNRVIIDDVEVLDQTDAELIRIGRLSTRVDWLPLIQGRIQISSVQIFGAAVRCKKKDEGSSTNLQFILDAFVSEDNTETSNFELCINSIIIRHSNVCYDQMDAPRQDHFNSKHISIEDISAHVLLKTFSSDSINVNVKRLAFKEKSGLNVKRLSFKFVSGSKRGQLSDFQLQLPYSSLHIDAINADYQLDDIRNTIRFDANGITSSVDSRDLVCFLPSLKGFNQQIDLTTQIKGSTREIVIPSLKISSPDLSFALNAGGSVSGLDSVRPHWHADIDMLNIASSLMEKMSQQVKSFPEQLTRIGTLALTGQFEGSGSGALNINSHLMSDAGNIKFYLKSDSLNRQLTSNISTINLDLGKILKTSDFGQISLDLSLSGTPAHIFIKGSIPQFDLNSYPYQQISIQAECMAEDFFKGFHQPLTAKGVLTINDPNLQTQIEGSCRNVGKSVMMQLQGSVANIAPKTLNLSSEWGNATFSARIDSDIKVSNLNDAEGTICIRDFCKTDSTDVYRIQQLRLQSGFEEGKHYLSLTGDMGSVELKGTFDWNTLSQSFISVIASRLPTLPGLPKTTQKATNDFSININIKDTEWLSRLANIPITVHQPITLSASINDAQQEMSINGNIPSFAYEESAYKDAIINITTLRDSLRCDIGIQKIMDDESEMAVSLRAKAFDNQLSSSVKWANNTKVLHKSLSGELNSLMQLYTDDAGKPEAYLHINPSHIVLGGTKWDMTPCDIFYTEDNLDIENFSVKHNEQHLNINGIASHLPSDTIKVNLKDIDVEYILDLVNFHSVKFEGLATGNAYISQPFDSLQAKADLNVKDFRFENGRMGTLHAQAFWNGEQQQIDIDAVADDGSEAQTVIKGYVSPIRSDIKLDIEGKGTYIDLARTYTSSFLKELTGHAYGKVQLVGPLGEMDLLGQLVVDGQATVIPLGTTYELRKDTLEFVHNDILVKDAIIYDRYNNTASITGGIHHDNLSNVTFDLDVKTPRFLAYDFTDFGNEIFCGTVVSEGKVDLHGRPGEIVINCDVTPLSPTVFRYNASTADAVSSQEFISWQEKKADSLSTGTTAAQSPIEADMPSDIYLNFLINANPDASLRLLMDAKTGDYITLNGTGVLRAAYHNKGTFTMYGTYTVERGTYGITIQNIIKKNFQFSEGGTIVFGGNPMNANLNLQAIHTVNGVSLSDLNIGNTFANNTIRVNCLMNILGQAGAPRVEFDLDMPTVNSEEKQMIRSVISNEQEMNQQVLYLLGIGRFYTQGINNSNAETQEYGQTELAMQSFLSGTLSTQINGLISEFIKNDNWNFGANISTGNEGWHNAEYEGLVSGRLLNNRLLINGQFGYRDNARQATPSFIGDFDIRYLLQPNGNLALKVYNQTNDRYFTRSSLNTQGIGIIIKRDFNGLSDLFSHRR